MPGRDERNGWDEAADSYHAVSSGLAGLVWGLVLYFGAILGPLFFAKEYLGDWFDRNLILFAAIWLTIVFSLTRSVIKSRASVGDAMLFCVTTLFYVFVAFNLLGEARAAV